MKSPSTIEFLIEGIWNQFGASIDMLAEVIQLSPEAYFRMDHRFYHLTFHTLIFLDYYLTIPPQDFSPTLPFSIIAPSDLPKQALGDILPDRVYQKAELIEYLQQSRKKGKQLILQLSEEKLHDRFTEALGTDDMDYPIVEILLYNLRHVQHHTGQLNLWLAEQRQAAAKWQFRVKPDAY